MSTLNVTFYTQENEFNLSDCSGNELEALIETAENLWNFDPKADYWFRVELTKDDEMRLVCRKNDEEEMPIPSHLLTQTTSTPWGKSKSVGERIRIEPRDVASSWPKDMRVMFTLIEPSSS